MRKILCAMLGIFGLFIVPAHALPTGYTELEYIDMPASTYLLTDVIPTYNGHYELDIQAVNIDDGSAVLGGRSSGYPAGIVFSNMDFKVVLDAFSNLRYTSDYTIENNTRYKYVFNNQVVTLYRDNVIVLTHTFDGTNANGAQLCINGINNAGNVIGSTGKIDVYSFKAWNAQGILVANFVPARRNSDNVLGMYDTVNNRFYTNAGSGSFIAGPVACDGERVAYTSATGTVVQNGTPTPTNPIEPVFYTQGDMVLRAVGNYKDSYDATTGKITRRVGVKVLKGTEEWTQITSTYNGLVYYRALNILYNAPAIGGNNTEIYPVISNVLSYKAGIWYNTSDSNMENGISTCNNGYCIAMSLVSTYPTTSEFKSWLAAQYAAGKPVVVYYPLATETTEDWTGGTSYCQQNIRVATTKYVETQFGGLSASLAAAVATVNTVVTNTINQAASIATLQSGKQTRPADDTCPAGKKCLLVEDASGVPHWYEIFDPINRWMEAFFKSNPNGQYEENGVDFRRWQGNPDFRETYIDGNRDVNIRQWTEASPARTVGGMYQTLSAGDIENAGTWAIEYDGTEGDINAGVMYGIAKCTSVAGPNNAATANPTKFSELSAADQAKWAELPALHGQPEREGYDSESFKQCWCKMTAVGVPAEDGTAANGSVYPVNLSSSAWVFYYTRGSAAGCADLCANGCADGVRENASFRTAVFGLD